jgi:hypothetical protein
MHISSMNGYLVWIGASARSRHFQPAATQHFAIFFHLVWASKPIIHDIASNWWSGKPPLRPM